MMKRKQEKSSSTPFSHALLSNMLCVCVSACVSLASEEAYGKRLHAIVHAFRTFFFFILEPTPAGSARDSHSPSLQPGCKETVTVMGMFSLAVRQRHAIASILASDRAL